VAVGGVRVLFELVLEFHLQRLLFSGIG
jgi:hypothetical protein